MDSRRQWTLILISCVDVHKGLDPHPPSICVHLRQPEPDPPSPSVWTS